MFTIHNGKSRTHTLECTVRTVGLEYILQNAEIKIHNLEYKVQKLLLNLDHHFSDCCVHVELGALFRRYNKFSRCNTYLSLNSNSCVTAQICLKKKLLLEISKLCIKGRKEERGEKKNRETKSGILSQRLSECPPFFYQSGYDTYIEAKEVQWQICENRLAPIT